MDADGEPDDGWLVAGTTDVGEVAARYDDWVGTYDDDLAAWSYRAPDEAAARVAAQVPAARRVLDAGCGTGLGVRYVTTRVG